MEAAKKQDKLCPDIERVKQDGKTTRAFEMTIRVIIKNKN